MSLESGLGRLEEAGEPTLADEADASAGLLVGPDSEQTPWLSVVMPTRNEARGIADCIDRARASIEAIGLPAEIIVSDSSTDATPAIAAEKGAIVVHPDEEGYGAAYQHAFERVRGRYVVMGDADCTYDFSAMDRLLEPVVAGEADLVLGSRLAGEIEPGAMPALHRYVGNPALTKFLNAFYDAGVTDAHSGFRVFRREVLEELDLSSTGMEFASEMVMVAAADGLRIDEVPITYYNRAGDATLESFRDGWRHVKFMLVNMPGYLFSVPGALLSLLGVGLMALAFLGVDLAVSGTAVSFGVRTMVVGSLLTLVGFQVASLGLFATIASDPIRRPQDRLTTAIVDRLSLELGATVGVIVFGFGAVYATYLIVAWITAGYGALPTLTHDIVAFTAIVLGVQTVFGSFFMSAVAE